MENILVSIRVRPLSKQEAAKGNPWTLTPKSIALSGGVFSSGQPYFFDRVFDPNSKTVEIYDAHTKKIISSAVQGFNGTIFAYGQTSSGKTHTMRGTSEEPGIIPLAVQDVFRNTELAQNREFLLRVSYMEIYNEEIKDLLAPENSKLQIHENSEKGIFVAGLREEIVVTPEQVVALMDFGEAHRHVGETNMNVHSSRSHAIFRMVIESRDKSQDQDDLEDWEILPSSDPVRVSHLNLVDLAGSERIAKTGAEGARLKEGTHINKSLMTLGNVINKLSEGIEKQGGHVPYRDSKLTRILQPALGGNARTVIICNITPSLVHVDETKGTLHFASRANRVTNCAQVNEIVTDAALLKRQKKEIAELRQKLQNQESPSDQFEEEILNLRNELLKTELDRERMASELQASQKAQAERDRLIKEQDRKIENLSTMVINSAVDDRELQKHSKRTNRRETWCARPQSGLPLLPDLKRPCLKNLAKTSETACPELPIQVNRERSFGLPAPFEAIMEEDEEMLTTGTISFDESFFHERLSVDDGFSLPEPGPQSSIADRRRRSSNDWILGNELEQQLLDLQRRYDTLQCDHVIKMNEQDSEIGALKKELVCTQLNLSKAGNKDIHKKVQDSERRGKSLDGWKENESMAMIKQLRAQVGELETEKLYMDRELQRLSDEAREQTEMSRQEIQEVYEELNLAKEASAKLNFRLDRALQDVQQFEMEKRENEVLLSELSVVVKDLETEVENIKEPCDGIQHSIMETLEHLRIFENSYQECLAGARDLSALGHVVHEESDAKNVDVLHIDVPHWKKEIDRLSLKERSLEEEVTSLKTSVEELEDDRKCWMKLSEERLTDIERQKAELEDIGKILLSTREDNVNAQKQISDLSEERLADIERQKAELEDIRKLLLSTREDNVNAQKRISDLSEERSADMERQKAELEDVGKMLLSAREDSANAQKQISELSSSLSQKLDEVHRLNKRLQDAGEEKNTLTKTVAELDSQLQARKAGSTEALKEMDGWQQRYETESSHYRAEIASLRKELLAVTTLHGALLNERDSLLVQLETTKSKMEDTEAKLKAKVQNKSKLETEKVENLTYQLSQSHENYSKLEFAMAEAESYSNEKVAQLEAALASLKIEKDAAFASLDRLQSDVEAANKQHQAKSNELESFRHELVTLTNKLQESEAENAAAEALVTTVTKEKEDIVEELLDAHIGFRRQKAELIAQAQESREKCNLLNREIVLLTEELQKLKELEEKLSEANRCLQNELQQILEVNTEKSLAHHKQVERLRLELQQTTSKFSAARHEEEMLHTENQDLLKANTKLQFAFDATRDREEIFKDRLEESDWELTQFKRLLLKTGLLRTDESNIISLQQLEKRLNAQNNEATKLETELASKKMEMIDLEVQLESTRGQCEKYEEEIKYLNTRVLTPEQETGVREIVRQNKKLQLQLNKATQKTQKLEELIKEKAASLSALQTTADSIHEQNAKLQKDLAASKAALDSAHQLHKIAVRAGAIGKSSISSSKSSLPGKLQPQATSETPSSRIAKLFKNTASPTLMAESTFLESSAPGHRIPLGEKSSNDSSPCILKERKPALLFPTSERSKLSRSLGLGPRFVPLPDSHSNVDLNKENFTLH